MAGPLVFVSTSKVKEGKVEAYKRFKDGIIEAVREKEPQIIAFEVFIDEERGELTSLQVHPDSASMEFHLEVMGPQIAQAYELLEATTRIQVYGDPSPALREKLLAIVGPDCELITAEHAGGFTRSAAAPMPVRS